jgi:hypothetical protein
MIDLEDSPITWGAADYEVGDRFHYRYQPNKIYTVTDRNDLGNRVVLKARLYSVDTDEDWGTFRLALAPDDLLVARHRVRTFEVTCFRCNETYSAEVDTAFFTSPPDTDCGSHC